MARTRLKVPTEQRRLRRAFLRTRCQAKFRSEVWNISWEYYRDLWMYNDQHLQKGKGANDLIFARIDPYGDWTESNTQIERKYEHTSRLKTHEWQEKK